ncbi:MAG: hypothetical protein AAB388_00945 [Patescibacteria group bacterium]
MTIGSLVGVTVAAIAAGCVFILILLIAADRIKYAPLQRHRALWTMALLGCLCLFVWFGYQLFDRLAEADPELAMLLIVWLSVGLFFPILLLFVEGHLCTLDFRSPNSPDPADLFGVVILSFLGPLHIVWPGLARLIMMR